VTSLRSDTAWIAPESPDIVWFAGSDATRFLNDLISQEIGDMADGEARRSFLLAPQGKLAFILWVIRDGDRLGLVTEPGRGAELAATLTRYRIRVDVEIAEERDGVWLIVGDGEGFDVSWSGVPRSLVVGERPDLPAGNPQEYEKLRVAAGEPAWDVDVDESTIPHESGLVRASVDFTKGCFLGQELVARIDSRGGNTPRHLRLIEAVDGELVRGVTLTKDGNEVGTVSSAAGKSGLAMVRREVEVGERLVAGDLAVQVRSVPTN
jgi:folate-binding protein YgfZ